MPELSAGQRRANALARRRKATSRACRTWRSGDPRQVGALADLVGHVRARGTRVVFLATPEGPVFRSWYPPGGREEAADWLRGLAARHGVPLVDASGWTDDEDLFIDSHHLTAGGVERFSRWLTREVLVPAVEGGGVAPAPFRVSRGVSRCERWSSRCPSRASSGPAARTRPGPSAGAALLLGRRAVRPVPGRAGPPAGPRRVRRARPRPPRPAGRPAPPDRRRPRRRRGSSSWRAPRTSRWDAACRWAARRPRRWVGPSS